MMVTPSVRLLKPLRDGGMGSVWVADHLGLKTQVVVKFIAPELAEKPEAAARFEREAAAAAQVRSPHVVQVFDHGTNADFGPYIVMELLEGQDLATYLKANRRLPAREVAAMLSQVAKALAKAHAVGIIHRDIKPDNIFLCDAEGGEVFVKLLDFGIAKADDRIGTGTTTGQVMGTPYYMSPEQLLAEGIDARTDIWSLGVVAFEAITGQRPFKGETIGALTLQIHGVLPSASKIVPDVPPAFDAWFQRACAKDRNERFATVREAAQALYEACQEAATAPKRLFSARPPMLSLDLSSSPSLPSDGDRPPTELSSTSGVAPPLKKDRKATMYVVAGGLLLGAAIGIFAFARRDTPPTADTRATGGAGTAAATSAATAAAATTVAPIASAAPASTASEAPPVESAAPSASAPAAPSKPIKVSTPRPTHRPPRPRDGFDDIK